MMVRVIQHFAKSFKVTQGHSKWHRSIDRLRIPIGVPWLSCIISEILVENRDIFIRHLHSTPPPVGGVLVEILPEGLVR